MNLRIKSMRCLRCGKKLPIGDYLFGCPHCLERGERSSVTFTYEGEAHIRTDAHGLHRYVEYLPYSHKQPYSLAYFELRTDREVNLISLLDEFQTRKIDLQLM